MPYIAISIVILAIIITLGVIFIVKNRKRDTGQETKKENKWMFWIGIAVVTISLIFFLITKEEFENKMWAIPIWIIGIGLIANSGYRFLK